MTELKEYRVETVLTLVTEVFCEDSGGKPMLELIEFMTGEEAGMLCFMDDSSTGRKAVCRDEVIRQYPWLEQYRKAKPQDTERIVAESKTIATVLKIQPLP